MNSFSLQLHIHSALRKMLVGVLIFLCSAMVYSLAATEPVSAARSCQSQYNAVAKATTPARERAAETLLGRCVKANVAKPWCADKVLSAMQRDKQAAIERCANWFLGGFKNPPNRNNANYDLGRQAKSAGAAQRTAYRQALQRSTNENSSNNSSSNNQGSVGNQGSGSSSTGTGANESSGSGSSANTAAASIDKPEVRAVKDPALECLPNGSQAGNCDLVKKYLNPIIVFLSAFVGIAVVIGIISGGIRYASASDDPQKSAAGRQMVRNSLIALVAYIFLFAALRWLVPQ